MKPLTTLILIMILLTSCGVSTMVEKMEKPYITLAKQRGVRVVNCELRKTGPFEKRYNADVKILPYNNKYTYSIILWDSVTINDTIPLTPDMIDQFKIRKDGND